MTKKRGSRNTYSQMVMRITVLLALTVGAGTVQAASVLNSCVSYCHGVPPRDAVRKGNPHFGSQSSAFLGNHRNHLPAVPAVASCSICHAPVAATDFGHQNNIIKMANSLKGYSSAALRAKYDKGVFFNQTSIPNLTNATCSNVNCHFEKKTPAWGTSASSTTCETCHGALVTPLTLAHPKHIADLGNTITACASCHNNYTGAAAYTHATSAGRAIKVTVGAYAGSNNKYLPSQTGRVTGTCSTLVCHGSGASLPWSGTLWSTTDQCGKCHSSTTAGTITQAVPFYSTAYPTKVTINTDAKVGAHTNHMTSQTLGISASTACTDCHGTVALTGSTHMNGSTTFAWSNLATKSGALVPVYNSGTGQCTVTYCHGNSMPGGDTAGSNKSPIWKDPNYLPATISAASCGVCHGFPPAIASGHPAVTIPAGFPATATIGTTCSCHSNINTTGNSYANMFVNPALHINGILETPLGGHVFPYGGSLHLTAAGVTPWSACTGCHSTAAGGTYPVAAGTAPNCTGCHLQGLRVPSGTSSCWDCHGASAVNGQPNGNVFPNISGSHSAHIAQSYVCADCHAGGGTGAAGHGNSAAVLKTKANVTVGLNTAKAGTAATWASGTQSCSTSICHGQKSPAWGSVVPANSCFRCHGSQSLAFVTFTSANVAPGTGNMDTGRVTGITPRGGMHQEHLQGTAGISEPVKCRECHVPVTAIAQAGHLNYTTATITFGGSAKAAGHNPTVSRVNGLITCNNTYCHAANRPTGTAANQSGINSPPVWNNSTLIGGTSLADTCINKCHALPPGSGIAGDTHASYAAVTTYAGLTACSSVSPATGCHPTISATTPTSIATIWASAAAKLLHINGIVDGGSCVGCHSKPVTRTKGRPGTTLAAVSTEFGLAWGHKKSGRGTVTDADCIVCHLEGSFATGKPNPAFHQDGNIDLRDPDGAGETPITNISNAAWTFQRFSTSYAAGSRTANGQTANTIDNVITQKFCVACHDSNGAANPTARSNNGGTGTAAMPFGGIALGATYTAANNAVGTQGLVDVKTQFALTNSSRHPLLGSRTRDFPYSTRLAPPYNNIGTARDANAAAGHTTASSVVINCFDCHNTAGASPLTTRTVAAHGNAVTLRGTIYAVGAVSTLCTTCHTGYTGTGQHGVGSAWSVTGSSHNVSRNCQDCHGSYKTAAPVRPVRAQDYHGNNALVGGGLWPTVNSRPYAFIRAWSGTAYHRPYRATEFTTGSATCGAGTCPSGGSGGQVGDGSTRTYTAGGTY